jgi:folylpolyglutamate synthase/dihydropteroate synthase
VKALKPVTALAVVTEPNIDRAEEGNEIFQYWETQGSRVLLVKNRARALALARLKANAATGLLVTGSLYLVGEYRSALCGIESLSRI